MRLAPPSIFYIFGVAPLSAGSGEKLLQRERNPPLAEYGVCPSEETEVDGALVGAAVGTELVDCFGSPRG